MSQPDRLRGPAPGPAVARTAAAVAAAVAAAALLLGGCGVTPSTTTDEGAAPNAAESSTAPAEPVRLPWPAPTAADAAALQAEVDRGAQPWLLEPSEVAIAFAAAAHGWDDAEAYSGPDGTSVDVRNAEGERRTLSLTQPAREGEHGIWVVTADQR